jgi:hypothetical protein
MKAKWLSEQMEDIRRSLFHIFPASARVLYTPGLILLGDLTI